MPSGIDDITIVLREDQLTTEIEKSTDGPTPRSFSA